jgi:hypothetical protein
VETAIRAWFFANWMYAGAVAAFFLLALVPLLAGAISMALLATYLHLPVYMGHQVEEHASDRFRTFANKWLGHGKDVLPTPFVVFVNVPGVWGVTLASLYLAAFADIGFGLIAVYLVLVNALTLSARRSCSAATIRGWPRRWCCSCRSVSGRCG